jgi:carbon starvation protein
MKPLILAGVFVDFHDGQISVRAMPLLLCVLSVLALAYRYYSAFLAAKVAALDDSRLTPAHRYNDGQNYHPTNRWVLFGHHFAAISGAGPLIGPVLAIQYGYAPGLVWLVAGVCLAGAVQDMLVLAASVRRDGKSLAEIARAELGETAAAVVSAAILFIVIIALAGLGIVVVKALGGESVTLTKGTRIRLPAGAVARRVDADLYEVPEGAKVVHPGQSAEEAVSWGQPFQIEAPGGDLTPDSNGLLALPERAQLVISGSSWGMFTIACTIPIALVVGWYMYRFRRGRVVEASLLGAVGVLAATILGSQIPGSPLHSAFALTRTQTTLALAGYGFVASVLPVWMLLCPRDYLSSFLKIGTIALLVIGLLVANPVLKAPPINSVFLGGGPTFKGPLFPFVFICIMCGAISGFHALVSSGTTPKMLDKESQVRTIGYGAMLMEGLVGVVALLAAATLDPVQHYYQINIPIAEQSQYATSLQAMSRRYSNDPMHRLGVADTHQLPVAERDLGAIERMVGGESLRGRTGGAVTLAVGIAVIFTDALASLGLAVEGFVKYWYHFAIMFEALFILTTIDTGTRIARFLLQEILGRVIPPFERADWLPGAMLSTLVVTAGWASLVQTGSISTIWPMFGIANQLLAVIALGLVTSWLINSGRGRYAWVTVLPMCFVTTTTMTAGAELVSGQFLDTIRHGEVLAGVCNIGLTIFVIVCVGTILMIAVSRWLVALAGVSAGAKQPLG